MAGKALVRLGHSSGCSLGKGDQNVEGEEARPRTEPSREGTVDGRPSCGSDENEGEEEDENEDTDEDDEDEDEVRMRMRLRLRVCSTVPL